MRKVKLYISMSVDGYLCGENDDLSFLDKLHVPNEDYGYNDFTKSIDTYIVGRKTYEVVKGILGEFPQAKQYRCFILSRSQSGVREGVEFYAGNLVDLLRNLRAEKGKDIYLDGGAQVVKEFMKLDLIDEYILSIVPTFLGAGTRLFLGGTPFADLTLVESKSYSTGLVQLIYRKSN